MWDLFRKYLWPIEAEKNPEFRAEIDRLSRRGLQITGVVVIAMPILGRILSWLIGTDRPRSIWETFGLIATGFVILSLIRTRWARRHSRLVYMVMGALCLALVSVGDLLSIRNPYESAALYALNVTAVLFVMVSAFPMLPLETASLGVWSAFVYTLTVAAGDRMGLMERAPAPAYAVIWVSLLTVLATGLSALNYSRLYTMFRTHRNRLEYQSRLMLSENSVAMTKFVAALNHEMNSPLGALASSMQTLPALLERYDSASPEKREALRATAAELCATAAGSVARLSDIVGRIRRMVNLDRADVQSVDINALLKDLVTMANTIEGRPSRVQLDLTSVPELVCRPQQITAVFGGLLHEALESSSPETEVKISTRKVGETIEVSVHDASLHSHANDGNLLEPNFTVAANRISGNWNLFTSRQIIAEHGGDIRIARHPEGGRTVTVVLLVDSRVRLAS